MNYIDQDEEDEQEQNTNENEFNKNKTEEFVLFKNEILKTIGALSENFNTQLQKQSKYFDEMKKEIKEQNSKKIKEITNELNKKDNQINEIKNILNEKISPNKTKSTNCITINYIKQMPQAAANLTNPLQP